MKHILTALSVSALSAQTPLAVHRQMAPPMPTLAEIQEAAKLLTQGNPQAVAPTMPTMPTLPDSQPSTEMPAKAPKGYKARSEVALDSATSQALNMATKFLERPNVPREGKDGRLVYTYGAGLPTLVCAPLRWCLIELIPGETAKNAVPSDERWDAKPLMDSSGDVSRSIIALRPRFAGLDSSLVILTDKHSYFLRLVSEPTRYMSRITFEDKEAVKATEAAWTLSAWQAASAELPQAEPFHVKTDDSIHPYGLSGEKDMWGKEKHPYFWPVAAYERGGLVYVTLPQAVADQRAPSLHRVGANGKPEPLNYSTEGNTFIAHTVEPRMILLRGDGKKAEKVYITKGVK